MMYGKISIKNIYYMLAYAFNLLDYGPYQSVSRESFERIHDLLATILVKGVSQQLKQGLYREYVGTNADLSVLRGKLNLSESFKHQLSGRRMLNCEYDEFTENNWLNQILKSTMLLLVQHRDVDGVIKANLKRQLMYFDGVDVVDLSVVQWSVLRFHRHNRAYRILIGICKFIVDGMIFTTDAGVVALRSFVDNQQMHRLYEKFILEYYRKEFLELKVSSSRIDWALDDEMNELLPQMQSDVMLVYRNQILIIDAKYYQSNVQNHYGNERIHSHNLYQIFTYVKNQQVRSSGFEVAGLLLYAKTDDAVQPSQVYQMSGNQIGVKTLDLSVDFNLLMAQLDAVVMDFFGVKKG